MGVVNYYDWPESGCGLSATGDVIAFLRIDLVYICLHEFTGVTTGEYSEHSELKEVIIGVIVSRSPHER